HRAGLSTREALWEAFSSVITPVKEHQYEPAIYYGGNKPAFSVVPLNHLQGYTKETYATVSDCL
ncbi:MAG TPA: hypothetical protein DDY49_00490, partial [Paenibacillaceae bacterium]|nr:hypothetical protein [Paenibacillaceae bacterium]